MEKRKRLHGLDLIRGVTLLSMIAYHGTWNLVYLFGMDLPWYDRLPGHLWQQSICWTFILLSGFCFSMGSRPLKRGLEIFGGGALVTLVTFAAMPENLILFGILTFTGSAMMLMILLEKLLKKVPAGLGAAVSMVLFFFFENWQAPAWLYRNLLTAYLGFPAKDFVSMDYFPILPWIFLFITGYFLYRIFHSRGWDVKLFSWGNLPVINWLGRHTLPIYLIHQPVLYGLGLIWYYLK